MGKFSGKTKLKVLVKDPEARKILEETFPVNLEDPTVKIAYGMTIEKCLSFPQIEMSEEDKAALIERLSNIE